MTITLKQVAQKAGVSFKTVSRVINRDPNVSPATRQKVESAIRELGYRPNIGARQMRTQRTHIIGFITDEVATTPHAVEMIKGAQDAAWEQGIMLLIANTERDLSRESTIIDMMLSHRVDGIIYATHFHRVVQPHASLREAHAVLLDCFAEDESLSSIVPNETAAGFEATSRLIAKGHRRIGFINLPTGLPSSDGRLAGYREALEHHSIDFDPQLVIHRETTAGGYEPALDLLRLSNPPTAIFCGNDRLAMGVYDAVKESGLKIPDHVAVMGFDNQTIIALNLRPPLTTMALPHYEMGVGAIHLLLGARSARSKPGKNMIRCTYIERASV